jgi:hypothetical protein
MSEGYEERADALERDADKMEKESERVKGGIGDAREDWEAKQSDQTVPGAQEDLEEQLRVDDDDDDGDESDQDEEDDDE